MSRMTRGVRIVNPDSGDTIAAMARLAASVEANGEEGRKSSEGAGLEAEVRTEDATAESEITVDEENGDDEAIETELAGVEG
jgi:hypothetical protein